MHPFHTSVELAILPLQGSIAKSNFNRRVIHVVQSIFDYFGEKESLTAIVSSFLK
jgi:hypothetical protein